MPMDVFTDTSLVNITGGVSITKDVQNGIAGNLTVAGTTTQSGVVTAATGVSVTAGGITVTAGGVSITAGSLTAGGGAAVTGGASIDQMWGGLSASAVSLTNAGTIAVNTRVSRFTSTAAVTGMIMTTGTQNGQTVVVDNRTTTGSFTATFAASGTSNVLGGTGVVISGMTNRLFVWDGSFWN